MTVSDLDSPSLRGPDSWFPGEYTGSNEKRYTYTDTDQGRLSNNELVCQTGPFRVASPVFGVKRCSSPQIAADASTCETEDEDQNHASKRQGFRCITRYGCKRISQHIFQI